MTFSASGNWGCGAFRGEPFLKSLLQLIVCTAINRPLVYYTFGNDELKEELEKMYNFLQRNAITVETLWSYLRAFVQHKLKPNEIFSFIYQAYYNGIDKIEIEPEPKPAENKLKTVSISKFFKPTKQKDDEVVEVEVLQEKMAACPGSPSTSESSLEAVQVNSAIAATTKSSNTTPRASALNDALNTDYYEKGPTKKLCT